MKATDRCFGRGFVCLSGSMGAGKTTLARLLLMEAADDGLVPMELIENDVKSFLVEGNSEARKTALFFFRYRHH